jgi:hypothetical protein
MVEGVTSSCDQYVETAVRWAHERSQPGSWAARREVIRRAAARADGNRASVSAFGDSVVEALAAARAKLDARSAARML